MKCHDVLLRANMIHHVLPEYIACEMNVSTYEKLNEDVIFESDAKHFFCKTNMSRNM